MRGATIGTWQADTRPEEQAQDIATAIDIARTEPQVFDGFRVFDLSDLAAPKKSGNVILKF